MRMIRGENERIIIAVDALNTKIEAADKGGYERGWNDSRNQLRAVLKKLSDQDVAAEIAASLKLAE